MEWTKRGGRRWRVEFLLELFLQPGSEQPRSHGACCALIAPEAQKGCSPVSELHEPERDVFAQPARISPMQRQVDLYRGRSCPKTVFASNISFSTYLPLCTGATTPADVPRTTRRRRVTLSLRTIAVALSRMVTWQKISRYAEILLLSMEKSYFKAHNRASTAACYRITRIHRRVRWWHDLHWNSWTINA